MMPKPMISLRVLIIEDEAMIAMLYSEVLTELGHATCAIATTEEEAFSFASTLKPDLMLVDMHLHEGSGTGAVTRILASTFIPHIFISGDAIRSQASFPHAIQLQKPFNEHQLARAVGEAMTKVREANL